YAMIMTQYVKQNIGRFSPNIKADACIPADEEVEYELSRKGSWLSTDEGYTYIKKLAAEGKISVITEDIRSEEVFLKISKLLIDNAVVIDTLYVSNIAQYMTAVEDKKKYTDTIRHLFTHETKLIHCDKDLRQTVLNGALYAKI